MADYEVSVSVVGEDHASDAFRQLNRQLDVTEQKSRTTGGSARSLGGDMLNLRDMALGALSAFSAYEVVQFGAYMVEVGTQVGITTTSFEALSDSEAEALENLQGLREATDNTVDDLTLMQQANAMLSTGIAQNAEDLERLTRVAVVMGGVVGQDATSAIQNLNSAIMNSSYERLDQLGISAGVVRERVNELKDAGIEMQAAFAQAVISEGEASVERLGDAASAAYTPLDRLATRWENFFNQASGNVAAGVQGAALFLEASAEAWERQREELATQEEEIVARAGIIAQRFQEQFQTQLDPDQIREFVERALEVNANDPMLLEFEDYPQLLASLGQVPRPTILEGPTGTELSNLYTFILAQTAEMERAVVLNEELLEQDAERLAYQQLYLDSLTSIHQIEAQQAQRDAVRANADEMFGGIGDMALAMWQEFQGRGASGGVTLFTPEEAEELRAAAGRLDDMVEDAQAFAEANEGAFSEAQLTYIETAANEAARMADEAERGARAFESMNLSELFGQTGGGRAGEFSDLIMEGLDLPDNQLSEIQTAFDLATGRETSLSQTIQNEVVPQLQALVEDNRVDEAITLMQGLLAEIENQRLAGFSDDAINANLTGAMGAGGDMFGRIGGGRGADETPFDPQAFLDAFTGAESPALAIEMSSQNTEMNLSKVAMHMQSVQTNLTGLLGIMPDANQQAGMMEGAFGKSETHIREVKGVLDELSEEEHEIRVVIRASGDVDLIRAIANASRDFGGGSEVLGINNR